MSNTESLRDEVRLQHQKMSHQPWNKKLDYYWSYYKVQTICFLFAAGMLGSILHGILTRKDTVLSVAYINAFPNIEDELFMDDFEAYLKLNPKKQQALLDSTYYITEDSSSPYAATYEQKFSVNAMSGNLDVVLADEEYFSFYAKQGFFINLQTVMTQAELAAYENSLFFCDLPDDDSAQEVPVGIDVSRMPQILNTASYPHTKAYYGIIVKSDKTETALSYLDFLKQN